ncbi:MAG: VCBS repeat-containing protein [Mongoliitalea sp.]
MNTQNHLRFFSLLIILLLSSGNTTNPINPPLFELLNPKKSGVTFSNKLTENKNNNILTYEYFYNGAGVAVGDINNDGLEDIFFTGNMVDNKLYLNKGDFKFQDITQSAGVGGKNSWTTGVTMVDINGDGLLDIYVCYSGNGDLDSRRNQLFINQGDLTFKEEASVYGLDDPSNSTQAVFFDFDKDGDLDLFLLNHHIEVINEIEFDKARSVRHPFAGDKLFRNDNGVFVDISEEAGIKGNAMGFGLGVVASDLNGDGWLDIYVSNDYIEQDYIYINNGDGTFSDQMEDMLQHLSHFSMGLDIADINNDGLMDIFTLDMLPEDNKRQKLLYGPENYEQYALMVNRGFYHQNMRNMLQLNQGMGAFSEIGQLAGISNTDWSWAALFFDANNSGFKDLFITNGYFRDYTNRDFLKYKGDYYFKSAINREKADTLHLVTSMSSTPIPNYIFENNGNLQFKNQSKNWGIASPGFSNGAAYADLNNDGYLDLIVNNINEPASIFQNQGGKLGTKQNFLQIKLKGNTLNSSGIGALVTLYTGGMIQTQELMPTRGFQSSVSHRLHFGLGNANMIDSIAIRWPEGKVQKLGSTEANQLLTIEQAHLQSWTVPSFIPPIFTESTLTIPYKHEESGFNDFKRQPLLIEMPSFVGPVMAAADITGDGQEEIFIGGSKGKAGNLFQLVDGKWKVFNGYKASTEFTDACALFADFNGDGWIDLYVCSGGYHDYLSNDESLQDRLYINDGKGNLIWDKDALPKIRTSTTVVTIADFNQDGRPDIFVGGTVMPGRYPSTPQSYLLINDGQGKFSDQSKNWLPKQGKLGMVKAAAVIDLNSDSKPDLIITGEYMPIEVFINQGNSFSIESDQYIDQPTQGWWSSIALADLNNNGKLDLIIGNFGLNSPFKPSPKEPLTLYFEDFDDNGSLDPILTSYIQGKAYPFASRDELLDQLYDMRRKFTDYASYATAEIHQVFTKEQLVNASSLQATELRSVILLNKNDKLEMHPLPIEAQFAPVHAIQVLDYDDDGNPDILLGGNQNYTRLRIGLIDASFGQLFKGDGKGNFSYIPQRESGLWLKGDIKSILALPSKPKTFYFGLNNQGISSYELQ